MDDSAIAERQTTDTLATGADVSGMPRPNQLGPTDFRDRSHIDLVYCLNRERHG